MANEYRICLTAAAAGRSQTHFHSVLQQVLEASGVPQPDFGSTGTQTEDDPENPTVVTMHFGVVAGSVEQLGEHVAAVEASLAAAGVVLTEPPQILSDRPVKRRTGDPAAGIVVDEESGTLTIDTWAPGWGDVEVQLVQRKDGRLTALVAAYDDTGTREEQAAIIHKIVVRRAGS